MYTSLVLLLLFLVSIGHGQLIIVFAMMMMMIGDNLTIYVTGFVKWSLIQCNSACVWPAQCGSWYLLSLYQELIFRILLTLDCTDPTINFALNTTFVYLVTYYHCMKYSSPIITTMTAWLSSHLTLLTWALKVCYCCMVDNSAGSCDYMQLPSRLLLSFIRTH